MVESWAAPSQELGAKKNKIKCYRTVRSVQYGLVKASSPTNDVGTNFTSARWAGKANILQTQ